MMTMVRCINPARNSYTFFPFTSSFLYSDTSAAPIKLGRCGERSKWRYKCFERYRFEVTETYVARRRVTLPTIVQKVSGWETFRRFRVVAGRCRSYSENSRHGGWERSKRYVAFISSRLFDRIQTVLAKHRRFFAACTFLSQVNLGLQRNDMLFTIDCLQAFGFKIPDNYKTECFHSLSDLKEMKVNERMVLQSDSIIDNLYHISARG